MRCDLSIIVPLYYEEDNVRLLHEAICAAVRPLGLRTEIVFVDDGSKDRTFERCLELPRTNPDLRLVKFRRNAGQTAAMAAGIDHARGDVLITMDGDLQNDPQDIPLFLEKIAEGYDLVVGWRHDRQDHWSRVLPSKVANWLIGKVTGRADQGQWLLAQGLPGRSDQEHPALQRDAPLHPGHGLAGGPADRADQGAPPSAPVRPVEIRLLADLQGVRGSGDDPQHPLLQPPAGDVAGHRRRASARWPSLLCLVTSCLLLAADPPRSSMVFTSMSVLLGSLSIFSVFLALLSHLIYGTTATRFRPFLMMSARASEALGRPSLE